MRHVAPMTILGIGPFLPSRSLALLGFSPEGKLLVTSSFNGNCCLYL